jgi:hypothetical protein
MARMDSKQFESRNVQVARKCLGLIRDIAARGADSWDPADVGYALQELSQVLLESTGTEGREFEPVPASEILELETLWVELQWVDQLSRDMCGTKLCN